MTTSVENALQKSRERITGRSALLSAIPPAVRAEELAHLRKIMFERRGPGEAFHPLDDRELALLEEAVDGYRGANHLVEIHDFLFPRTYAGIRYNLLSGELRRIPPALFRAHADYICERLVSKVVERHGPMSILFTWRAGFAFAAAAVNAPRLNAFYHIGAARNEATLETEIYYEELPAKMDCRGEKILLADPMLATGNTAIAAINLLAARGMRPADIIVVSVISAPEGVDHILSAFPGVTIFVGAHDERLNERGYIVPGLGDFGDLYFEGLGLSSIAAWHEQGILKSKASVRALEGRLRSLARTAGLNALG